MYKSKKAVSKTCQNSTTFPMEIYTKKNYNKYSSFFDGITLKDSCYLALLKFICMLKKEQKVYGGKNVITEYSKENKMLIVKLTEEIDQHTTDKIRRKMDNEIEKYIPRKVLFDFSNISFMDSSGIGLVLRKI